MAKALKATLLLFALVSLASIPSVVSAQPESSGGASGITAQQGPPSVSAAASPGAQVRLNSPVPVTATFSEPVSGFTVDDISVGNGTASSFSGRDGDTVYTFDVTPNAVGDVTVNIAAGAATDGGGAGNAAAPPLSLGIPYDFDGNWGISKNEAIAAVVDYFAGRITKAQTIAVIVLYFSTPDSPPQETPSPEDFPWVQDGLTGFERPTLFDLRGIEGSHPEIAQVVLNFPWLADGITDDERRTVSFIRALADQDTSFAMLLVGLPWMAGEIGRYEPLVVRELWSVAREDLNVATSIANLLSLEGPLRGIHRDFVYSLRSVFERDQGRYELLIGQSWLQDGLTEEEIALVVVLPSVVASDQLFGDFIEGAHVQSETLSLDLAGEVTLFAVSRTPLRPEGDMLEGMRFGVDALEDFMGAPWPKTDVIALVEPELYPPSGSNSGSHIVLTNTARILLYHELAHFYFGGNVPFWLSEGAAVFFSFYTLQLTGSESLLAYYDSAHTNVGCARYGVTNVQEWNEASQSGSPPTICAYEIGARFVIGMYEYLGHEVVSSSMRELSSESPGSRASEEQIYLSFLSNTPPPKQDDFRDLYLCLHGRPIPSYSARPSVTPSEQRAALVALYDATGGASWNDNSNWLSESPVNQWYRVFTDCNGGVTSLWLPSNQLRGPIPQKLGDLSDLRYLTLQDNELTGQIPAELGNLTNLHTLRLGLLGTNQLTGPIPPELGRLTKLELLSLTGNQLTGQIPGWLGDLTRLQRLHLGGNQLTGEIPAELGELSHLEWLSLGHNQLTGPIPAELSRLYNMRWLNLDNGQLTGSIPAWLGNLAELKSLYLDRNQLTGEIPAELGSLLNLKYLRLYDNQLTGEIPAELGRLSKLQILSLNSNQLTRKIPSELGNLTNLEHLYLSGNQLTGEIPAELGSLTNLEHLYLSGNQLTGEIPAELGSLLNLEHLYLSGNQLTGEIPTELGSLSNLQILNLNRNQLTGEIPAELGNLTNLEYLNLSGNQLTGEIPAELGNLTNLEYLNLSGNQLTGEIPAELGNLTNLEYLYLSGNQLTGTIPPGLGNLNNLEALYIEGNNFTGCIPASLRNVPRTDFARTNMEFCDE